MTISRVSGQQTVNVVYNTQIVLTLPNNPTPGNLVIVGIISTSPITSVKDSSNNSYTSTPSSPFSIVSGYSLSIFYLQNAPSNATKTITIIISPLGVIYSYVSEVSGAAISSVFEREATYNLATAQAVINAPTITTTNNGDYLFSIVFAGSNLVSVDRPWSGVSSLVNWAGAEDLIQSNAGSVTVAFTQVSSVGWSSMVAAFKAATSTPSGLLFHQSFMSGLDTGGPFFANPIG